MLLHTSSGFFDAEFTDYLKLGWDHIIDLNAYDHLLFVMTLCALFTYAEWRKILVIVTAFTIGHSLTLALSALDYVLLPQDWVELMIPLTILITSIANVARKRGDASTKAFNRQIIPNYFIALCFGLVHGLGFANNFKFMLGDESSVVKQLFAFNTGLELGQVTVVIFFMLFLFLLSRVFNIVHREWTLFFSGAGAGIAVVMIIDLMNK